MTPSASSGSNILGKMVTKSICTTLIFVGSVGVALTPLATRSCVRVPATTSGSEVNDRFYNLQRDGFVARENADSEKSKDQNEGNDGPDDLRPCLHALMLSLVLEISGLSCKHFFCITGLTLDLLLPKPKFSVPQFELLRLLAHHVFDDLRRQIARNLRGRLRHRYLLCRLPKDSY